MKICSRKSCKQLNPQPISSFYPRKNSKDGLRQECKLCNKEEYQNRKPELKIYQEVNNNKIIKQRAEFRKNNKKVLSSRDREYYQKNKKYICERVRDYGKNNRGKKNTLESKRRAQKIQATPPWLTKDQLFEIQKFYIEAARLTSETGTKHHVDHIVPLQGEQVRGLHVPWNLQILTAKENISKSNKFIS